MDISSKLNYIVLNKNINIDLMRGEFGIGLNN